MLSTTFNKTWIRPSSLILIIIVWYFMSSQSSTSPVTSRVVYRNLHDSSTKINNQRIFRRNSLHNEDLTTVTDISTALNNIEIQWNVVVPESGLSTKEIQWLVRVREFGKNSAKVTRVIATLSPPESKDYSIRVDELTPATAYEACVHTINHTITKKQHVIQDIKGCNYALDMMCFEVITKSEKTNVAVASAISSASTFVIVVLCFCCFIPRKAKQGKDERKTRSAYFKITNLMSSKDGDDRESEEAERDTPSTSSATMKAKHTSEDTSKTNEHVAKTNGRQSNSDYIEYYIDPKDIVLTQDKSVKVYSRQET